ncbi:anti-sigma regulatory factor [Pleurocapsales cyanobacterium LEGE 10410]|nr:anti-sigma regulatory factor [Pleurocapsales cyanobacterium LEGE 10410]
MSFTSTLYLCPVLDLLLVNVPPEWRAEVRLGLQEALVNAAKHGNKLDPSKTIIVRFTVTEREYSWVIVDEGGGFAKGHRCLNTYHSQAKQLPTDEAENGRGFSILHEVFDDVHWNRDGTQLTLSKAVSNSKEKQPSIC